MILSVNAIGTNKDISHLHMDTNINSKCNKNYMKSNWMGWMTFFKGSHKKKNEPYVIINDNQIDHPHIRNVIMNQDCDFHCRHDWNLSQSLEVFHTIEH